MLAAALVVLFPALVRAQGTETDEGTDVRARVSAGVDKKISKGFHVYGEFEGRFKNNIQQINDLRLSVGTTYKFGDFLKAGAGYTFIDNLSGSGDWEPRHRLHADRDHRRYLLHPLRHDLRDRCPQCRRKQGRSYEIA